MNDGLPYGGSGRVTLDVNLPAGQNTLTVSYLGDAYFAPEQASVTPSDITTAGWSGDTCPSDWVTSTSETAAVSVAESDIPMNPYGFPLAYGKYDPAALANPNVGTFVVQLNWADVEPAPGSYDFTTADDEVQAAVREGKRVALVMRFQEGSVLSGSSTTCGWNKKQLMPEWVVKDLGTGGAFCSHGMGLMVPDYWSPEFTRLWTSFVNVVAIHFAADAPSIAYVRGPLGLGDEGIAITGPNYKALTVDVAHLRRWGYTPQLWEAWQEDMLMFYRQAFAYSPWVLYTINKQEINDRVFGFGEGAHIDLQSADDSLLRQAG